MTFGDLALIAVDNLRRTKLRTFLTTLGVVIGIGVLVSMVSFGSGVQRNVTETFRKNQLFTTLQVLPVELDLEEAVGGDLSRMADAAVLDAAVLDSLRNLPGVVMAYPEIRFPVILRMGDRETRAQLAGLPVGLGAYPPFDDVPYGRFFSSDDDSILVVTQSVLADLGFRVAEERASSTREEVIGLAAVDADSLLGRRMEIVTSVLEPGALSLTNPSGAFRDEARSFPIGGIMAKSEGLGGLSLSGGVNLAIETAESVPHLGFSSVWDLLGKLGSEGGYPSIHVRVAGIEDMSTVRAAVEDMGLGVFTFSDQLEEFREQFIVVDALLGAVGTVALVIAALGIINTMVTSILERTREIGIMKALGGNEGQIRAIFFIEAGVIGVLGGVFGNILGWGVTRIANSVANYWLRPQGVEAVDFFHIPLWLAAGAVGFAVVVSLLAGLYPAARAARVDPVRALRHD
ncbi:MAG: FtsX-like permease family protein [Candidatus Eisenbacteria bacterium]|nr:FtsX-like permease family protein [Candidatus Eisenbacteria bacterium]